MRDSASNSAGLPFSKMHGLGNDFVVIDARMGGVAVDATLARALGDRHRGVGFDQLAVIREATGAHAQVDFFNADGSMAGACGNATRCVADLLMTESGVDSVVLRTERGDLACEAAGDGLIRVNMGHPQLTWSEVPLSQDVDLVSLPIDGAPGAVGMGNPHCVFIVENADSIDIEAHGPEMEHHPLFPERTNVEFVEVRDRANVSMRVWERGLGVTLACGSGACAAAVIAHRKGLTDRHVTVHLDGGPLVIDWRDDGVWMTGPTARVFDGTLSDTFLTGSR